MNNEILSNPEEIKILKRFRETKSHEEYQYLHLLEDIIEKGVEKADRTNVGTKSIYGTQLKFDLRDTFPILTTKKVFFKGVVEELLWFIRGETDSRKLEENGINIWKGNTTREFLDKRGLDYPEGEIGPGYGFQWRHWGSDYTSMVGYSNPLHYSVTKLKNNSGIDQLSNVVDSLINNPSDRRMIVSAWNVSDIRKMALPPCHLLFQFDVTDGHLNCMWFQRSVDTLLGLPFNISSYALLTYLIAKITNLKPGTITYCGGDTHLYMNHIEQAKEQISRSPYPFPQLNIKKDIKTLSDIENLQFEDFELVDYKCHPAIKAPMAV